VDGYRQRRAGHDDRIESGRHGQLCREGRGECSLHAAVLEGASGVDRYDIEIPEHQTLQWSPPDVTATVNYTAAGVNASLTQSAYYRYDGPWVGWEKQKIVNVVPSVAVKLTPDVAVVPLMAGGKRREFRVTVANNDKTGGSRAGAARSAHGLDR
jgi:hypothetical protein